MMNVEDNYGRMNGYMPEDTRACNCGCNCCCTPGEPPRVPTYSYEFMNIGNNECEKKEMTREEMLEQIRCLNFAIVDVSEYLNTHPEDAKALCLHKEYAKRYKDLKEKYQKVYGPLSIYFPCNKWRWLEEPWPWERGSF